MWALGYRKTPYSRKVSVPDGSICKIKNDFTCLYNSFTYTYKQTCLYNSFTYTYKQACFAYRLMNAYIYTIDVVDVVTMIQTFYYPPENILKPVEVK